jgi:hypothetical protein
MWESRIARLATLLAALFVIVSVVHYARAEVRYAVQLGDNPSEVVCKYSEANGVRAGAYYAQHGFTSNFGLPDIAYGHSLEWIGGKHDQHMCSSTETCIYLHTPPGAELLTGVATKLAGEGHIARFRILPLFIACTALAFLAWAMIAAVGPFRAACVMATFPMVPMMTSSMHTLCFVNYEAALVEAELGVLLLCFFCKTSWRIGAPALFVLGFFSGCISYDYAAHVALVPVCVWLLRGDLRAHLRVVLVCTAASCAGYAVACALHFYQVASFLGSWHAMLSDYVARANARMGGHVEAAAGRTMGPGELLRVYLTKLLDQPQFFRGNYLRTCGVVLAALYVRGLPPLRVGDARYLWEPQRALRWSFVLAFLIPLMWIVVMRQHSSAHVFYLPRNFGVTFILGALAFTLAFRRETPGREGAPA